MDSKTKGLGECYYLMTFIMCLNNSEYKHFIGKVRAIVISDVDFIP